jgi:hypothetical protein
MTNEEAIRIFNTLLLFKKVDAPVEEIEKCLKMSIQALEKEQKIGHWTRKENEFIVPSRFNPIKQIISTCSICGSRYMGIHKDFKYCPNCGAKMVEPQESEGKNESM